jgi:1-deoxy-D-xylulose-5-phosphate synthase
MKILAPVSLAEQQDMLHWAVEHCHGPVAIRYPRGTEGTYRESDWKGLDGELVKCHRQGKDVTLITYGNLLDNVLEAAELLSASGVEATVLRLLSVSDLAPEEILKKLSSNHNVIVVEEVCGGSGIREALAWELHRLEPDCRVAGRDLGKGFVPHGSLKELHRHCGLDAAAIADYTKEVLSK